MPKYIERARDRHNFFIYFDCALWTTIFVDGLSELFGEPFAETAKKMPVGAIREIELMAKFKAG